jgi:cytochrome b561
MDMSITPRSRYDGIAMLIHWLTAVLMIYMVFFGEDLMKSGEKLAKAGDTAGATFEPSIHVTLGVSIFVLTLLRIVWRLGHTAPAYPVTMKRYEVVGSKALHGIFYLLLLAIPLTGWIAFGGLAAELPVMSQVQVFGLFAMPQPPFTSHLFKDLHELGSNAAMFLIGLHVLAALKHQFIDKDSIFGRILPW